MEVDLNFTYSCEKEQIDPIIYSRFYWRIYDAMCIEDGDDLTLWNGFLKISYNNEDYKTNINNTLYEIISIIKNFLMKSTTTIDNVCVKITKKLQVTVDKVLQRDVDYDYDEDIYWHYCERLNYPLENNSKNFLEDQDLYIKKTTLNF